MMVNSGSFRDPSGQVFVFDGKVYRSVFAPGLDDYTAARDEGVFERAINAGLLISHEEVDIDERFPPGTKICLHHPRLPFVSYPWEWSFSMLKDAALLHLDLMELLLPHGFWLRDASAFNVQFDGSRLRFIDTLSIGRRIPESPWVAYGQFCSHFLAPLAMATYSDIRTLGLWRSYIDGYPLDLAVKTLPRMRRYRPGLFMHLTLHARAQRTAEAKENLRKERPSPKPTVSDRGLIGLIRSLRKTIQSLHWKLPSKIWEEYADIRTYDEKDLKTKTAFVEAAVARAHPKMVWDLGANTGEFSIIAASKGAFTVSIDGDAGCTERAYRSVRKTHPKGGVLPLTMDLANPSPDLGWDNRERFSLKKRGPADLILALALIHHLVLSAYVPMAKVAAWLASLSEHLVIEFVPPSDPMVQRLLENRESGHHPYDINTFDAAFDPYFEWVDRCKLDNGRVMFLGRRKRSLDVALV